jgi:IPT/TIG domain
MKKIFLLLISCCLHLSSFAGQPLFLIEAQSNNQASISSYASLPVIYKVTNNSKITRQLTMRPTLGIEQNYDPYYIKNLCQKTFTLEPNQYCYLVLLAKGPLMLANNISSISNGPVICKTKTGSTEPDPFLCQQPAQNQQLNLNLIRESSAIKIDTVYPPCSGSTPNCLSFSTSTSGWFTISNTSSTYTANNVQANLNFNQITGAGQNISDYVTQDARECAALAPRQTCNIYFRTANGKALSQQPIVIYGDNTNRLVGSIEVTGNDVAMIEVTNGNPMVLQSNDFDPGTAKSFTVKNNSNTITASNITLTPGSFDANIIDVNATNCSTLTPGATCTISVAAKQNTSNLGYNFNPIIAGTNTSQALTSITVLAPQTSTISISPSTLAFQANQIGNLSMTITNSSSNIAYGITTSLTANDGIYLSGTTCTSALNPNTSCTLSFALFANEAITAAPVSFQVYGSNTNINNASYSINQNITSVNPFFVTTLGGTVVTINGQGFTGATNVQFGTASAQSFKVVNSTQITAVTPANTQGPYDVSVVTPAGTSTLSNGITYNTPAVGQQTDGGTIACSTNGGDAFNLIVYSKSIPSYAYLNVAVTQLSGPASATDGQANTTSLVSTFGSNAVAANYCNSLAVDAYGNKCTAGSQGCYTGWFLPAKQQLLCLYTHKGVFTASTDSIWSSTFASSTLSGLVYNWNAFTVNFSTGETSSVISTTSYPVFCTRSYS